MLTYPPVKKVSVVIPVYNEQDSLPELLRRTDAACATLGRQYEILLIDDGSSDDSARMLTEAAEAEGSHVVAVLLNRNYGQHSAIMAGFSHVTGDLIITLDADLQNPPEEIPRLFDRFYKTDRSRSLDKNGVGLGLSICRTIMNVHEGEIFVRSQPGEYTEFVFGLKADPAHYKKGVNRKAPMVDASFTTLPAAPAAGREEKQHEKPQQ